MADVFPFAAIMPTTENAQTVSAPPYDVVSSEEAANLAEGNPLSFLRVSRPEIELPAGTDLYSDEVYEKAAANYTRLKQEAPLVQDNEAVFYVYSLVMNGRRQTGVVAAASVEDYDKGIIKKHEKTRQDKEDDRTRHIMTLNSQTGPVFLTYRDHATINGIVEETMSGNPLFDFVANDGITNTIWRVDSSKVPALQQAFAEVPYLYIADGHHRAASASRTRAKCKDANPSHTGNEEYNRFLTVIFPESQLQILAYNRAVKDLNGLTKETLLDGISKNFDITEATSKEPAAPGNICMYLDNTWYALTYKGNLADLSPVDCLDVSLLQDLILNPLLGIDDPRTSKRIDFIGGIRGTAELEQRVDSGGFAVAFSMYPTTVAQLMDIADADAIMPPKSTWFEPKLRDGLLIHDL